MRRYPRAKIADGLDWGERREGVDRLKRFDRLHIQSEFMPWNLLHLLVRDLLLWGVFCNFE
ncbi:MAG: hypothetical protein BJG00_000790 [Limnothrix sp. CACIAM 69d]|nr:MAG: hypothetical protein BJG00_000790 [Limnothrix sp. CACIAM 69d]